MSEKKQVQLNKPLTWAGENYSVGLAELPAAAADYAVKRGFGSPVKSAKSDKGEKSNETEKETTSQTENKTQKVESLPEDFPMRHLFEKLGFNSVEEVQAKSRDELIALDGIAEKTADKALNYGK